MGVRGALEDVSSSYVETLGNIVTYEDSTVEQCIYINMPGTIDRESLLPRD